MKNKIVVWGTNGADERVLVALELKIERNKVMIYTFPEAIATDDFYKNMMDNWRDDKEEVVFPEGHQVLERELSITESILPEDLKVERTDLIQRAQTEWHFVVLSSKLSEAYKAELQELEDKVAALSSFDKEVWEGLKTFWAKVQGQMRDRTILREHAEALRNRTNKAFEDLKAMRSKMEEGFRKTSAENVERFNGIIDDIENRIKDSKHLSRIFEELKKVQKEVREFQFTKDHRNKVWNRIDKAFKDVKAKRFGDQPTSGDKGPLQRVNNRYNGLLGAIERMEKSIARDENELEFQHRQINRTDGQLEAQIRQAKLQMIEQRLSSKRDKLAEMMQTKEQLEKQIEREKEREAKRKEKQEMEAARAAAQAAAKEKIAADIKEKQALIDNDSENLASAAEAINQQKRGVADDGAKKEEAAPQEESILGAIATTIGESLEDVVDTVKAVAEVVGEKIGEAVEEMKEELQEVKEEVKEEAAEMKEEAQELVAKVEEKVAEFKEEVKEKKEEEEE